MPWNAEANRFQWIGRLGAAAGTLQRKSQREAPAAIVPVRSSIPLQASANGKSRRHMVYTQSSGASWLPRRAATGNLTQ